MRYIKAFVPVLLALIVGACAPPPQQLTLEQNKPEIDAALKAYADVWSKANKIAVTIKSVGGSSGIDLGTQLKADYAAGYMPDIFAISGLDDYKQWANLTLDLTGEKWVNDTSVAFKVDGKVYGFPVAIEGWGLAYNADILKKAGVDPLTLNNYAAYKAAFSKIDAMKGALGLKSVVSMAASIDMSWVTRDHDLNALLSNGLPYGDMSVTNDLLAGKVDAGRMSAYADWVELIFKYADRAVLTTGNYDAQVGAFASGKAAFLHQGNWVDPNLAQDKASFTMAFAPYGSTAQTTDGIFVAAPSFYVINKNSKNIPAAKKFLTDLVYTEAGNKYMVVDALMIPAYKNITLSPTGQLSKSVQTWATAGKIYSWNQYYLPQEFREKTLAPIYNQFATGAVNKAKFIDLMTKAFESLKK
jgi:raffinose/stachyose/melibiose transport system substrate-binding protein